VLQLGFLSAGGERVRVDGFAFSYEPSRLHASRRFASHCHACDTVLRDAKALALFDRELPDHWLDVLASRLMSQQLWYRSFALREEGCNWLPAGWMEPEGTSPAPAAAATGAPEGS